MIIDLTINPLARALTDTILLHLNNAGGLLNNYLYNVGGLLNNYLWPTPEPAPKPLSGWQHSRIRYANQIVRNEIQSHVVLYNVANPYAVETFTFCLHLIADEWDLPINDARCIENAHIRTWVWYNTYNCANASVEAELRKNIMLYNEALRSV